MVVSYLVLTMLKMMLLMRSVYLRLQLQQREEADRYVIYTYLVIGDILSLDDGIQNLKHESMVS